jgi:hypothetical protein
LDEVNTKHVYTEDDEWLVTGVEQSYVMSQHRTVVTICMKTTMMVTICGSIIMARALFKRSTVPIGVERRCTLDKSKNINIVLTTKY